MLTQMQGQLTRSYDFYYLFSL